MPVTTPWTSYTPSLIAAAGQPLVVGNGTLEFRARRLDGQFLWAARLLVGSTTTFGSGRLAVVLPAEFYNLFHEDLTTIAPALLKDASAAFGSGTSGTAELVTGTENDVLNNGSLVLTFSAYIVAYFGGTAWSGTNPVTLAMGDLFLAGNALEALDN